MDECRNDFIESSCPEHHFGQQSAILLAFKGLWLQFAVSEYNRYAADHEYSGSQSWRQPTQALSSLTKQSGKNKSRIQSSTTFFRSKPFNSKVTVPINTAEDTPPVN